MMSCFRCEYNAIKRKSGPSARKAASPPKWGDYFSISVCECATHTHTHIKSISRSTRVRSAVAARYHIQLSSTNPIEISFATRSLAGASLAASLARRSLSLLLRPNNAPH